MLAQLKTEVYLQYSGVQSLSNLLTSCPPVVETLDLYRGFLYMGIINVEGGKLDQKAFWDRAKSIGENAIGFIPVVGNFVGAVKMTSEIFKAVQEFRGIDAPEIINEAQFVELFMNKYQQVLGMWIASAEVYIEATKGLTKSLKKYKFPKKQS